MAISLPSATCTIDRVGEADDAVLRERIIAAKEALGERLLILGHHYQRDSIIEHADLTGDSFMLSELAAASDAELIVFCGVHFMAESADILTDPSQTVIMPTTRAGCSMADMANVPDVAEAWESLLDEFEHLGDPADRADPDAVAPAGESYLVPVTYMNSSAALKAFVGAHGGIVCTSSNARGILDWALARAGENGKVLFFPDQHLGRNTALAMGHSEAEMAVWTPGAMHDWEALDAARFVLWHGYCSVHQRFTAAQIHGLREAHPDALVVVHPECPRETVDVADANGSTNFIRQYVADAPSGSVIGVGTEINLVQRLDDAYPNKTVICLDPAVCPCSTMYMIHPMFLCDVLERMVAGEKPNVIAVDAQTSADAKLGLDRMLSIRA